MTVCCMMQNILELFFFFKDLYKYACFSIHKHEFKWMVIGKHFFNKQNMKKNLLLRIFM